MKFNKTKILIGILIVGIVLISGWWIWKYKETGKRIEIKGKLEMIEEPPFLLDKECGDFVNTNFKVGSYYLKGVCKKYYLVASLLDIVGREIEVRGRVRVVEAAVPSEENPEVFVNKTFEVIEVEEITPPEIIMVVPDTNQYRAEDKISIHIKHYLKKSIFVSFGPEGFYCAIKSIEKKDRDGEWKEWLSSDFDCDLINLKEIKPYHLSGEFNVVDWQPSSLEPGQYRFKITYKLAGEDDWKEVYSNEFIVLKEAGPGVKAIEKDIGIKIDLKIENEIVKIDIEPSFASLNDSW
ncbi:hypothetical protein KJ636_04335, partial [Patescibacteria group bacterium]|nr:hypothetical protein [Patescibacteria group bacterium]